MTTQYLLIAIGVIEVVYILTITLILRENSRNLRALKSTAENIESWLRLSHMQKKSLDSGPWMFDSGINNTESETRR